MFRSRFWRALALLTALAGLMYVMISLYLPSSRKLIFGVDKKSGRVRVVRSRITFLPPHQFYRLAFDTRDGYAQRDGLIRILSREKVPVVMTYRIRFSVDGKNFPDAKRLVHEGWNGWMRARVGEVVAAVAEQVPIEELLSPTSQFRSRRDPLRAAVAEHLARSGLRVTAFEIARIEADHEELLKLKRAELRRSARGVVGRVALFAIDGADWDLINELVVDERLPNLKALIRGGASASVQAIQPTVSPMSWTTVATGLTPDRHGIIDFVDHARKNAPVDGFSRREAALWEIAEAFGRHGMVANWWASWPPASRETVVIDTPAEWLRGAISPEQLSTSAASLEVPPETVGYEQTRRFLNITPDEYRQAVEHGSASDPVIAFRSVLAKTWNDHRVAINFYSQQQPLLLMMSYDGTDAVNHLFGPYHPPYREGVSQEGFRRYWPAVANYYSEIDRLIGEWLKVLPSDTTVMIVSAHGFHWGEDRPRTPPVGRSALVDHRNVGVFIAYGNRVVPSRSGRMISLYDIAPTILAILGLPKSAEMPGQIASWALRDITPVEGVQVVSYSEYMNVRPTPAKQSLDPHAYQIALQSIGHLIDASKPAMAAVQEEEVSAASARPVNPQQWGAYAFANNQGVVLRREGKTAEAVAAFQRAIDLNPSRPTPYLNLAMTLLDRQQYESADEVFLLAVGKGLPNADRWFADFAAWYRERNMTSRAINLLYRGKEIFPQSYLIAVNLGSALSQASRYGEGLPELERALGLQPSSTAALNDLGVFYARRNDYGRALDFWNRSLAIDPRQPQIRQAAEAARSRL